MTAAWETPSVCAISTRAIGPRVNRAWKIDIDAGEVTGISGISGMSCSSLQTGAGDSFEELFLEEDKNSD